MGIYREASTAENHMCIVKSKNLIKSKIKLNFPSFFSSDMVISIFRFDKNFTASDAQQLTQSTLSHVLHFQALNKMVCVKICADRSRYCDSQHRIPLPALSHILWHLISQSGYEYGFRERVVIVTKFKELSL